MYNIKKMNYYFYIIFKLEKLKAPVAQWIRCFPPKEKIPGSSPGGGGFFDWKSIEKNKTWWKIFTRIYFYIFCENKTKQLLNLST